MRVENPGAQHVRVFWRMPREKRSQVWDCLGGYDKVQELHLGGEGDLECPVDLEELRLLLRLPQGPSALLSRMQVLVLLHASEVDDRWMQALASSGCGAELTRLVLHGAVHC